MKKVLSLILFINLTNCASTKLVSRSTATTESHLCSALFSKKRHTTYKEVMQSLMPSEKVVLANGTVTAPELVRANKLWLKNTFSDSNKRFLFNSPIAPDANETTLYNWSEGEHNYRNLTEGMSYDNAKKLIARETSTKLGLYTSTHPVNSSLFGSILMEVSVYRDQYPVLENGTLSWKPVTDLILFEDRLGYLDGSGHLSLPLSYNIGQPQLLGIASPLIIKELRWPKKTILESFWTTFNPNEALELSLSPYPALQWVVAQNFKPKERQALYQANPEKLAQTYNLRGPFLIQLTHRKFTKNKIEDDALFLNALLQIILNSQTTMVDVQSGLLDYKKVYAAFSHLSLKELKILERFYSKLDETGRIHAILQLLFQIKNNFPKETIWTSLNQFFIFNRSSFQQYIQYNPEMIIKEEANAKSFIDEIFS